MVGVVGGGCAGRMTVMPLVFGRACSHLGKVGHEDPVNRHFRTGRASDSGEAALSRPVRPHFQGKCCLKLRREGIFKEVVASGAPGDRPSLLRALTRQTPNSLARTTYLRRLCLDTPRLGNQLAGAPGRPDRPAPARLDAPAAPARLVAPAAPARLVALAAPGRPLGLPRPAWPAWIAPHRPSTPGLFREGMTA